MSERLYEKHQLRALIDTAVDGILSIDAAGTVLLYNKASERIFGFPRDQVVGRNVAMLMPAHYAVAHQGFVDAYLETGVARIIGIGRQVEGKRADGSVFPMDLSVGEFEDEEDRHFVGIVRDLSAEVAERERTQALQEQLEMIGRHSAVSEMGAALAHELNQPLTAIDLFLVAAERQLDKDPAKAKALFGRVRGEAERAGAIVRRIREMVERSDGERARFTLDGVVDGAVELCRVVDRHSGAIETGRVPKVTLFGDEVQIRMILVNVIKNALDATEGQEARRVRVEARREEMIVIDVLDNGPGVPPAFMHRLFEPFASTKKRGLGIGLSICQTIAESHGGRLSYIAQDRQERSLGGACFRLELPDAEALS